MSRTELAARVGQVGANAALVISMWKGNPSLLIFISSTGDEVVTIKMESAKLRREVNTTHQSKMTETAGVFAKSGSGEKTRTLCDILASFLNLDSSEISDLDDVLVEENQSFIWLEDLPSGKTLWTHYHSEKAIETGPRIRVTSVRSIE